MAKYRNQSWAVDAIRWLGDRMDGDTPDWIGPAINKSPEEPGALFRLGVEVHCWDRNGNLTIAKPGHWIVRAEDGGLTAWWPDLFHSCHVAMEPANG